MRARKLRKIRQATHAASGTRQNRVLRFSLSYTSLPLLSFSFFTKNILFPPSSQLPGPLRSARRTHSVILPVCQHAERHSCTLPNFIPSSPSLMYREARTCSQKLFSLSSLSVTLSLSLSLPPTLSNFSLSPTSLAAHRRKRHGNVESV